MTTRKNEPAEPTDTVEVPADTPAEGPTGRPAWIRVRSKGDDGGHEFDVAGVSFDPDMHVKVNKQKQYPDLYGDYHVARPAKYRTDKAGSSGTTQNEES